MHQRPRLPTRTLSYNTPSCSSALLSQNDHQSHESSSSQNTHSTTFHSGFFSRNSTIRWVEAMVNDRARSPSLESQSPTRDENQEPSFDREARTVHPSNPTMPAVDGPAETSSMGPPLLFASPLTSAPAVPANICRRAYQPPRMHSESSHRVISDPEAESGEGSSSVSEPKGVPYDNSNDSERVTTSAEMPAPDASTLNVEGGVEMQRAHPASRRRNAANSQNTRLSAGCDGWSLTGLFTLPVFGKQPPQRLGLLVYVWHSIRFLLLTMMFFVGIAVNICAGCYTFVRRLLGLLYWFLLGF